MIARPFGSRHNPLVTQTASARATNVTIRSARRSRRGDEVGADGEVGT
ncbi:hypothetical protein Vqi01_06260 [Micromonospora qiuiae]|uniref:Uncharacterized protein n=1 Tax=Micromonospora qiuiae TaxID=502268 RepID=A0ABQ4J5M2_9ACTN|nr:hypothetical protein Vqi01_06260 [Micromonospora qiuiae]